MSFLPENYESPTSSGFYMKYVDGENRIRILSRAIVGWEDWQDKKPIRYRFNEKPLKSIDPDKAIKHFWALVVFNYNENQVQILQINQAGIRKCIENLSKDEDWGQPYFYDLKIIKKGEGKETEYAVNPVPHKPVDARIEQDFINKPINLDALFDNSDPFAKGQERKEEFMCNHKIVNVESEQDRITTEQFASLLKKLERLPDYSVKLKMYLKEKDILDLRDIKPNMYAGIVKRCDEELKKAS